MKIEHVLQAPRDEVEFYWQTLAMHDMLKYRMSDVVDPFWSDVLDMIRRCGQHMYLVRDDNEVIVAEFMLENFIGKSAQIHFSMSPSNSLIQNLMICKFGLSQILSRWKDADNDKYPFLESLYGITPVHNRRACIFVLKAGFRKLGILRSSCDYLGHLCDGMITTAIREDLEYGR